MGFLRYANVIGQPHGGLGVSLAAQGFVTSGAPGIVVQAPQFEGVENIVFPSFVMGVPITNETQINNTLYLSDTVSKVIRPAHPEIWRAISPGSGQRASQRHVQRNLQHRRNRNRLRLCRLPDRRAEQFHAIVGPAFLLAKSVCGIVCARQLAGAKRFDDQFRPALGLHHAVLGKVQPNSDDHSGKAVGPLSGCAGGPGGSRRSGNPQHDFAVEGRQLRPANWPCLCAGIRSRNSEQKFLETAARAAFGRAMESSTPRFRACRRASCMPFLPLVTTI